MRPPYYVTLREEMEVAPCQSKEGSLARELQLTRRTHLITDMRKEVLLMFCLCGVTAFGKTYTVTSPDGRLCAEVSDGVRCTISCDGRELMKDNLIGLDIEGETFAGKIESAKSGGRRESTEAPFYRQSRVEAEYNWLTVKLGKALAVEFRAYNEGIAYRFVCGKSGDYIINDEKAEFNFTDDYEAYLPYSTNKEQPFAISFENTYTVDSLSRSNDQQAFLPATIDCGDCKVTLMEADLEAYPGMFVKADGTTLRGVFAKYPKSFDYHQGRRQMHVKETMPYIAQCKGVRTLPWRVMAVSREDKDMPTNNLVYLLASENRIGDTSWIKPGKVAWDWWNDWGLERVPFKAGINTATYKYYIDFAAKYGLEYVILDEGWYKSREGNVLAVVPEIDLPELVAYGEERGVGIVLWMVFNALDEKLEEACRQYSEMGVRGFKVDFLDRDDQTAVEMVYRIAEKCAEHHLILDYHGIFKPTGINRTYPNVLNYEAIYGLEQTKWTGIGEKDLPPFDVTFPFIRMQTGFLDYTPGGMRNATKADYRAVYRNPMTMGTRCHQAAMYVVLDSPFTMLADSPSAYEKEPEYTSYIAAIPTVYDEMRVLQGKIGEYIVTARRKGDDWYVGGLTNWDKRALRIDFGFLGDGAYEADMLTDGVNANKVATDYERTQREVTAKDGIDIELASGGGFIITLRKQ